MILSPNFCNTESVACSVPFFNTTVGVGAPPTAEQSFQMGYSGDWSDYVIELDCDDRRVYLIKDEDTKIDISKYVDHNSDWFRLSGEFEFEGINCTILTVTFNERW